MQKLSEICITTYKDNSHKDKVVNHGTPNFWVNFADGCPVNTNHVYNPKIKN